MRRVSRGNGRESRKPNYRRGRHHEAHQSSRGSGVHSHCEDSFIRMAELTAGNTEATDSSSILAELELSSFRAVMPWPEASARRDLDVSRYGLSHVDRRAPAR